MFCQTFCQKEIDILPDFPLSGFRNSQFHTGRDGHSRDNLSTILIDETGLFMIRFEFLITNDLFNTGNNLLFGKYISLKSQVIGIPGISQSVFRCQCRQLPIHLITNDIT